MTSKHIPADDFVAYIYRTLDDAQREFLDAHLLECASCRSRLAEQEMRERHISNDLKAALNFAAPSGQMSFAAVAPSLKNTRLERNTWLDRTVFVPTALVLTGFAFAVFGLLNAIGRQAFTASQPLGAFPTLSCFFLALASLEQLDSSISLRPRRAITWAVAVILWLGSAFIGLLDLLVLRDLAIMGVIAMDGRHATAGPIAIITVFLGAMLYIGFIIGGAEYHYKNIGQPGSWKLFTVTLLGQLFILILPYLIR